MCLDIISLLVPNVIKYHLQWGRKIETYIDASVVQPWSSKSFPESVPCSLFSLKYLVQYEAGAASFTSFLFFSSSWTNIESAELCLVFFPHIWHPPHFHVQTSAYNTVITQSWCSKKTEQHGATFYKLASRLVRPKEYVAGLGLKIMLVLSTNSGLRVVGGLVSWDQQKHSN